MRKLIIMFVLIAAVSGCVLKTEEPERETLFAMSTVIDISVYGGRNPSEALEAARNTVYRYETQMSVTERGSDINRINESNGQPVSVDKDTAELIRLALQLSADTNGSFDITVYPAVKAWGFTTGEYRVPSETEISELIRRVDYKHVFVDSDNNTVMVESGTEIDLGAAAKGFIGDRIIDSIRDNGAESAIINLGGNVQTYGDKPDGSPWRVAIRNPQAPGEFLGIVTIGEGAVITSGAYERFFTAPDGTIYHHIIDPLTGYPADSGLSSVTVVIDGSSLDNIGFFGDALSTALFVSGSKAALDFFRDHSGFELVLVEDDHVVITPGLADRFQFLADDSFTLSVFEPISS